MTTTKQEPGVLGEAAAPLGVTRWVDASGQALEHFDLDRMPGRFKLIFCFQDACPGCHATGFPALARVVDAFRGSDFVGFAAVQTVFEDFGSNTWSACWPITPATRWAFPSGTTPVTNRTARVRS